jgi:HPt (histidine-containing phosphotransfer) domain-containing protein
VNRREVPAETALVPNDAPPGTLDRNRLEAILQAAGPSGKGELLAHLLQDLHSVQGLLRQAVADNDTATTRAQSHILISLAGAIGADRLQVMAEALNAAAHRNRLSEAQTLVRSCDEALASLIVQVECRAGREDLL